MKTMRITGLLLALVGAAGCASAPVPVELANARTAYDRAQKGPTAQLDPADLHTAKETLDAAERSFNDDGDSQETRDTAYTAERRVEIAEAKARTLQATQQKDQTLAQMHASETATVQHTAAALGRAKEQLASQNQQLATKDQQLEAERQRREDAEKRAAQAATDLARIASVKQEARGMVITLSGSVLFESGKSELLPAAQVKLNEVADALIKQDKESTIVVEGHTDSQGSASTNQDLSQRRAQSVRDYLVSRGLAADRLTAQGFGSSRAVADNASPEGRANNRRVELVVKPSPASSP
jgi:outer membrane protein OmpA-like peptidoglycan-associated protein